MNAIALNILRISNVLVEMKICQKFNVTIIFEKINFHLLNKPAKVKTQHRLVESSNLPSSKLILKNNSSW